MVISLPTVLASRIFRFFFAFLGSFPALCLFFFLLLTRLSPSCPTFSLSVFSLPQLFSSSSPDLLPLPASCFCLPGSFSVSNPGQTPTTFPLHNHQCPSVPQPENLPQTSQETVMVCQERLNCRCASKFGISRTYRLPASPTSSSFVTKLSTIKSISSLLTSTSKSHKTAPQRLTFIEKRNL